MASSQRWTHRETVAAPLTRHFYEYKPPRPLEEIEADIKTIEKDIVRMLAEVTA